MNDSLLSLSLAVAVPLRILEIQTRGGITDADLDRIRPLSQRLGEKGDILLFKGAGKPGECAALFNEVADALAVLAFLPGGVKFLGHHFQGAP